VVVRKQPADYAFSILNDPAYKQLRDSLSSAGISDAAHLRGAIQQALIGFGAVPNLPTDVLQNSGLDTAGTQALADNNPFSTLKRLQQSYQDQQDATKNQLAARGALSSGETGYQLGRLGQNQAGQQYDATSGLLGNIGTLNDQYAAGRQAAAQQLAGGAMTAESNAASSGGGTNTATVTANWDPNSGLYLDGSGQYYDQNGNPVSFNAGSTVAGQTATQAAPDTYTPSTALGTGGGGGSTRYGV